MELRQLEYFVAVAEEANFTRAAKRVHVSQSGISAQIRELEKDLGSALFDRSSRIATLTAAGEAALTHARIALAAATSLRTVVDDVNDVTRGRLVVGMVTACTITGLFDALAAFHDAYPGVEVTLVEDAADRLVAAVRSGAMDMALVAVAGTPPPDVGSWVVVSESLVAAVPSGHPLADRKSATLSEISQYPIVCMPAGSGIRSVFDLDCAAAGVSPDIAIQASAPASVADMALRGFGVAIMSESMAVGYTGRLTAVAIDGANTAAVLALVWSASPSAALQKLIGFGRSAFGTLK